MPKSTVPNSTKPTSRRPVAIPLTALAGAIALLAGCSAAAQPAGTPGASQTGQVMTLSPEPSSTPSPPTEAPTSGPPQTTNPPVVTTAPTTKPPANPTNPPANPTQAQDDDWTNAQHFLGADNTAHFRYFTVSIKSPPPSTVGIPHKAGFWAETCVIAVPDGQTTLPITLAPWSLTENDLGYLGRPVTSPYAPAYPASGQYGVGQCAKGFISFDIPWTPDTEAIVSDLRYANSLGDKAVWNFH